MALCHDTLEGRKVDLSHRAFVSVRAGGVPVVLLVVQREVLYLGGHVLGLQPLHPRGGQLPGQVGVLAEVLEVPTSLRYPHDVDTGRVQHVDVDPAPLRMVLGSQALDSTLRTLRRRVADFESQTELAASTDFPPGQ